MKTFDQQHPELLNAMAQEVKNPTPRKRGRPKNIIAEVWQEMAGKMQNTYTLQSLTMKSFANYKKKKEKAGEHFIIIKKTENNA